MGTQNLSLKNIREFTPEDTIYLHLQKYSGGMQNQTLFCQFMSFDEKKSRVRGKVLAVDTNSNLYENKIKEGWEEEVPLKDASLYGKDVTGHTRFHRFDPIGHATYATPEDKFLRSPKEHPTYGMMAIGKTTISGSVPFFGSSILQPEAITITIKRAKLERSLHNDRYDSGEELIRVEMTPLQFAEFLISPNTQGVPVTISRFNGEGCGDTPFVSKIEQFHSEFQDKIEKIHAEAKQTITTITALLEKPNIGKGDREHIRKLLQTLNMQVENNLPFLGEQFSEQMDRTVGEAKATLTQFLHTKVKELGLPEGSVSPPLLLEVQPPEK